MRAANVAGARMVAMVFTAALALQALLHRHFAHRSLEWIPLAAIALALRVGSGLLGRRGRQAAAKKAAPPVCLKA